MTKSVNAMMGRQETSHQQVMSYLVGGGDFYSSHTFRTFRWFKFTNAAEKFEHDAQTAEGNDVEDDDDLLRIEEAVTVNISAENVEFASDIQDYALQPCNENFNDLCLWVFIELTIKMKGKIDTQSTNHDCDESDGYLSGNEQPEQNSKKRRHKRMPHVQLLLQHGQRDTHYLRLRKMLVVPVLLGAVIPRPDGSEEDYEEYCWDMLLLFKPWCTLADLKGGNESWAESFVQHKFTTEINTIIRNMNVENECKDTRDQHAALVVAKRARPHIYGSSEDGETQMQEDMAAFDEALFNNTLLDPDEIDSVEEPSTFDDQRVLSKHTGEIRTCLCSANDGGLLTANENARLTSETHQQIEKLNEVAETCIQEYVSIMKAAKKRK